MAEHILSGVLKDPNGDFSVGDQIRFTHISTTGETILSARSIFTVPPNGEYTIGLQFGLIRVEYWDIISKSWSLSGEVTINQDTLPATLPGLLNTLVPVLPPVILEMEALVADAETAAADSLADADRAEAAADSIVGVNLLINGDINIWQRGTPIVGAAYGPDRWRAGNANITTTRTTGPSTLPFTRHASMVRSNLGSVILSQGVELEVSGNAGRFITGSFWTFSYYIWAESAVDSSTSVDFVDDVDGTGSVEVLAITSETLPVQTWTRIVESFTVSASPAGGNLALRVRAGAVAVPIGEEIKVSGLKLEPGLVVTPFTNSSNTIAGEVNSSQRYGQILSTNSVADEDLRPSMRATPVVTGSGPYFYDAEL